uniref:Uncharacterized protein n=1 Tax=Panagrolaimus sp. ES5 TaxID=591445 RepID=A0AC34FG60_9BILA
MLSFMHNLFAVKLPQKNNELKDANNNHRIQTQQEKEMLKNIAKNAGVNSINKNIDAQLAAISEIRELMSSKVALVTLYEAASVIINLCQNGSPQIMEAIFPVLKQFIQSSDTVLILLIINGIFYAIKKPEFILLVIDRNIVKHLVHLSKHPDKDVKMTAFVITAQIFEGDYMKSAIRYGIIKVLPSFLEAINIILKIVSNGTRDDIHALIQANVLPFLCSLLKCDDSILVENVLIILNDILQKSGKMSSDVCKIIKNSGEVEVLTKLISISQSLKMKSTTLYEAISE